jgi:hypothetical protein
MVGTFHHEKGEEWVERTRERRSYDNSKETEYGRSYN